MPFKLCFFLSKLFLIVFHKFQQIYYLKNAFPNYVNTIIYHFVTVNYHNILVNE